MFRMIAERFFLCALIAIGLGESFAHAVPVVVTNPGFEDISGETVVNEFTFGPLNGWDLYDPMTITTGGAGDGYFIGTLTPFEPDPIGEPGVYSFFDNGAAEGQRVGIAFNNSSTGGTGEYGLEQTLVATLQPNTRYTLDVEIGNIDSGESMSFGFFNLAGFPGYRVELLAGGQFVSRDDNSLAGEIEDGEFGNSSITFVTGAEHPRLGQFLGIRLVNENQVDAAFPDADLEVDFDNVRLDATAVLPGDFQGNADVDGSDFLSWQRGFPAIYGATDLANWQANYGDISVDAFVVQVVPEPGTMILACLGLWGYMSRNRIRVC